jgi:hypothetical protein
MALATSGTKKTGEERRRLKIKENCSLHSRNSICLEKTTFLSHTKKIQLQGSVQQYKSKSMDTEFSTE